jgi:hypothetical protein
MPDRLKELYPAAWTITELPETWRYVHVLCMPLKILSFLNGLPPRKQEGVLPFVSLNDLLTASSSHVIGFNPNPQWTLTDHPERPWLYTTSQDIELDRLRNLMTVWVQSLWGVPEAEAFVVAWGQGDWVWQKVDLSTVEHVLKRRLLPGLITRWLLDHEYQLTLNGQRFPLRAVAATEYAESAELMTEPIGFSPKNAEKWSQSYSYVLRFSVLDTPNMDRLSFAHRLMVRRWRNQRTYVKLGGKRSVYLRWSPGYLDRKPREHVYGRVKLSYIGYVGGEKQAVWVGNQARVFGDLGHAGSDLPPAKDFIENPYLYHETGLMPALSGDNDNKVRAGLSHNDQYEAFEGLSAQLAGFAVPFGVCQRVTLADITTPKKERNQSFFNTVLELPPRLATPAKTVRVELHTQHVEHIEQRFLEALDCEEGNARRSGDVLSIPIGMDGQTLEVVRCNDPDLIAPLDEGGRRGKKPTEKDNQARIRAIEKAYPKPDAPTAALIELMPYHDNPEMKHRDPKQAIREGLIKAGRIAKFFTPQHVNSEESIEHRILSVVSAALRGLGCRVQPFYIPQEKSLLPQGLDILGMWVIRLNRRSHINEKSVILPVLVEANSTDLHLKLYLPDGKGSVARYASLYEALLGAWGMEAAFGENHQADIRRFFRSALHARGRKSDGLLILDEQNLRRVFSGLNSHRTGVVELDELLTDLPQIRVARLKYSHYDEAPLCLPGQPKSKYAGLYGDEAHPSLFYSLHEVGNQKPNGKARKADNPSKALNTVGTVQVWMNNLQAGDDPAAWAGVVHQLRHASNHIDFATRIPQPLHDVISWLPKHLARYVVVSDDGEMDEPEGEG